MTDDSKKILITLTPQQLAEAMIQLMREAAQEHWQRSGGIWGMRFPVVRQNAEGQALH